MALGFANLNETEMEDKDTRLLDAPSICLL